MARTPVSIRPATTLDAAKIASINVSAWHDTYVGLIPSKLLSSVTVKARTERWQNILGSFTQSNGHAAFLAEVNGTPQGYVSVGRQRDNAMDNLGYTAEVISLNVIKQAWRLGVGRALMHRAAVHSAAFRHTAISLWVLDTNARARKFYQALGGCLVSEREDVHPDATLREVAYGWRDLSELT